MNPSFADKVVLISGAGKGIGKAVAYAFAKSGAKIAVFDKDPELIKDLGEQLKKLGATNLTQVIDIKNLQSTNAFVDNIIADFGKIDILINNVGLGLVKKFSQTTPQDLELIWRTNFYGPFFLTQKVLQYLDKGANIIFITSIHSKHPSLDPSYDTSKSAIDTLILDLALTYASKEIRVNGIAPGHIDVHTTDKPRIQKDVPLFKRAGLPEDIAQACLFLADNQKARYITGEILHVTGGLHIPIAKDLEI